MAINASLETTCDILCQRWVAHIIDKLDSGTKSFNTLKDELGINYGTLTNRLEVLEEKKVIRKIYMGPRQFHVEYALTEIGHSLRPVITTMRHWGENHTYSHPLE